MKKALSCLLLVGTVRAGRLDLTDVKGLVESDDYQVWIDGKAQFVFKCLKQTNHGTNNINSMSSHY